MSSRGQGGGSASILSILVKGRVSGVCQQCQYWSQGRVSGGRVSLGNCPVATKTLLSGLLLYFGEMCMFESFVSSPGRIISTNSVNRNSSSLLRSHPLPFHPLRKQRKKGQMLFTLSDPSVIYIYPVLYTALSQSPSCHHSKQIFFLHCAEQNGDDRDSPGQQRD